MRTPFKVIISDEIASNVPQLRILKIEADIINSLSGIDIQKLFKNLETVIRYEYPEMGLINKRPGIAATRNAYKLCGKDPNRYRPSQEQLTRRIVSGKELYLVSSVVDVCNYVSILSGYSIGAFDASRIVGDTLTLGIGKQDEPYEGIGRGCLNIEGMPVYRDEVGGVGTPTSDNERTKLTPESTSLLVCVNIYGEDMSLETTRDLLIELLQKYCHAANITSEVISTTLH